MKIIKNILSGLVLLSGLIFSSCDNEPDIWSAETEKFCGDWELSVNYATLESDPITGGTFQISNTVDNNDELIVHLSGLFGVDFQAKADIQNLTFSGTDIKNGKIILDGVEVKPSKLDAGPIRADSIYFEIDDEGDLYLFHGYRHTGWEDD